MPIILVKVDMCYQNTLLNWTLLRAKEDNFKHSNKRSSPLKEMSEKYCLHYKHN